jgi:hypothetical protein
VGALAGPGFLGFGRLLVGARRALQRLALLAFGCLGLCGATLHLMTMLAGPLGVLGRFLHRLVGGVFSR